MVKKNPEGGSFAGLGPHELAQFRIVAIVTSGGCSIELAMESGSMVNTMHGACYKQLRDRS